MKTSCWFIIIATVLLYSCSQPSLLDQTLELAGENRSELEKVLDHYKQSGDKRKYDAALFLITNMGNKHSYKGEILDRYKPVLDLYDSLYRRKKYDREHKIVVDKWNEINKKYGEINVSKLERVYDCRNLSSAFLIRNIDDAFTAWEKSPLYDPGQFEIFCEYILPYRMANETPEVYRKRYYEELKHLLDTISNPESIIQAFHNELQLNRKYNSSKILWDYPVEFSISEMEKTHKGACRHLTTFGALSMRACGLPVTVDRAVWANRNQGHSWNVLMLDSGKILPFDALDKREIRFAYKPCKIFRKTYSLNFDVVHQLNENDVPASFFILDEQDVTDEYVNAYDISIPVKFEHKGDEKKKLGVICIFDNKDWRIVHWGIIKSGKMHFRKMAADVAYIGAYYEDGKVYPATEPFLLRRDGSIDYCIADEENKTDMKLNRKYPLSDLMKNRAHGLLEMQAQGANNKKFDNPTVFFTQAERTFDVTDSLVNYPLKFRYVRLLISKERAGNLAEVEFYGKENENAPEEKLEGEIIGYPSAAEWDNPYTNAIDGDLDTFFEKDKRREGWVGLELKKPYIITRIRFCPRSDTNFILEGDTYEMKYWNNNRWNSVGTKVAEQYNYINFEGVPAGTMYLLHNLSRGKEERIFTFENAEQVWW